MDNIVQPQPDTFLDLVVSFKDGTSYERLRPLPDYRRDPGEARILYICKRSVIISCDGTGALTQQPVHSDEDEEFVMKIKIQVPPRPNSDDPEYPLPGPSETTQAELHALRTFQATGLDGVPHFVSHKCSPQGPDGPFPGGYISYTVMTKMPGQDLMASRFWSLSDNEREERRQAFLIVLKYASQPLFTIASALLGRLLNVILMGPDRDIWRQNIAPYDCALRNVLWDPNTHQCSIVDFEHYRPAKDPINMYETEEMQRWGLVHRPPPSTWAVEWGLIKEVNSPR